MSATRARVVAGGVGMGPIMSNAEDARRPRRPATLPADRGRPAPRRPALPRRPACAARTPRPEGRRGAAGPPDDWGGETGMIDAERLDRHLPRDPGRHRCFLSGPPAMMELVGARLRACDVPPPSTSSTSASTWSEGAGVRNRYANRIALGMAVLLALAALLFALAARGAGDPVACRTGDRRRCRRSRSASPGDQGVHQVPVRPRSATGPPDVGDQPGGRREQERAQRHHRAAELIRPGQGEVEGDQPPGDAVATTLAACAAARPWPGERPPPGSCPVEP
jgi:hypothetical protein